MTKILVTGASGQLGKELQMLKGNTASLSFSIFTGKY
jgi:dTDP-4-dehydrorhamnose reductase